MCLLIDWGAATRLVIEQDIEIPVIVVGCTRTKRKIKTHKECIYSQRSKMNFNSMSSMSTRSEPMGSWNILIRTCSIFVRSRWRELSSLSSNTTNSGTYFRYLSFPNSTISNERSTYLSVFLPSEGTNDILGSLWISGVRTWIAPINCSSDHFTSWELAT